VNRGRLVMRVAWPAFLAACLLEALVFAVVDPLELHWAGAALGWSRGGVYTAAFFAFWVISSLSGALTALLIASERAGRE
jgi:hypothetical protein